MNTGHVFVVEGSIGRLVADATIIPTDLSFTVEKHWHNVLTSTKPFDAHSFKPENWESTRCGRSRDGSATWFVDVADQPGEESQRFERLKSVLHGIASQHIEPTARGRLYPLVVMPVLGTKGGGFGHQRGQSIKQLLRACRDFEPGTKPIDLAIVTRNRSSYGALQEQRRRDRALYFESADLSTAMDLGLDARHGRLALFIGAGASVPAGAPSWKSLMTSLAAEANLPTAVSRALNEPDEGRMLDPLDQAELLSTVLGEEALAARIQQAIQVTRPALAHALLAALRCQGAITTNYDNLYESAVRSRGGNLAVLPVQRPVDDGQWILKMHGDLNTPKSIVLTRRQFVRFTSISGPSGAVLQTMLLTKRLLVVGASMSDPNVLRLIHEVAEYRELNQGTATEPKPAIDNYGTILDISADPVRRFLHEKHFTWPHLPGDGDTERARELEIFLDAIAMFASSTSSWLLDEEFTGLHSEDDTELVSAARRLHHKIIATGHQDGAWAALVEHLESLGARQADTSQRSGSDE